MFNKVISKRTSVLMAFLMLAVGLMMVSGNTAYATHGGGPLYETDFGTTPPGETNLPLLLTGWNDGDGVGKDCATQNVGGGEMALQVRDGCAAFVTVSNMEHDKLRVEYTWGYKITGRPDEQGELRVHWKLSTDPDVIASWNEIFIHVLPFPNATQAPTVPASHPFEVGTALVDIDIRFWGYTGSDNHRARVDNLVVIEDLIDYLPDGTITYTQGYYGQSRNTGEEDTCTILTWMETNSTVDLQEIRDTLTSVSVDVNPLDIDTDLELCEFLVGVDIGPGNNDDGFMPAGKIDGKPKSNQASQKITLLLNLNLGGLFGAYDPPTVDQRPILRTYEINIDPVQDVVGGVAGPWYDPVLITDLAGDLDEKLGDCDDFLVPFGQCDPGTVVLTPLGMKVKELDIDGTTVGDIEAAACVLLATVDATDATTTPVGPNGEVLTQIQIINILSLINKSYDAGVINGFVTDGDPPPN